MAKITEEQKALNKAASKLRNAAFKSRRDAYEAALSKALAAVDSSELGARVRQADEEASAFVDRHQRECGALREQIEALKTQLAALEKSAELEQVREHRRTVSRKFHAKRREVEDAVREEYPDVCSAFTAAAWRSLEEYLPAAAAGGQAQTGSHGVAPPDDRGALDDKGGQP